MIINNPLSQAIRNTLINQIKEDVFYYKESNNWNVKRKVQWALYYTF